MDQIDWTNKKYMRSYKYETHLHTREGSACASATAAEFVRFYASAGYAGIIITDHFLNGNTTVPKSLPWAESIDQFCAGYDNALEEGKRVGLHVFLGWEYAYNGTEFLTYGLDKQFLLDNPDMLSWSVEEYLNIVHQNGGFIVHAHPFRMRPYIKKIRLYPDLVDAIEVVNAGNDDAIFDQRALEYAQQHSLIMTSGADIHHLTDKQGYGIAFDHEISSMKEFVQSLKCDKGYTLLRGN